MKTIQVPVSTLETLIESLDADLCEYLLPDVGEEYHYLFRNGEWVCYDMHQADYGYENSKLPKVVEIPVPVAA